MLLFFFFFADPINWIREAPTLPQIFNNFSTFIFPVSEFMETNSSTSFPQFCGIFQEEIHVCFKTIPAVVCLSAYTITIITIQLPLCIYIIYLGFQRQRSSTPMRHSDFFTYHIVAVELIGILGTLATVCGTHTNLCFMNLVGMVTVSCHSFGQMLINILTCGEYYLAAVYPVIYLSLQKAKGIRIRNIAITCAWLSTFGLTIFTVAEPGLAIMFSSCLIACVIIIVSFLCVSVLCVLIVPGPGKGSGAGVQVDQTKLKAFCVMMVIMGVLLLRFVGNMVTAAMFFVSELGVRERCIAYISIIWTFLPNGALLPLLFLHRAGKLACIKKHKETGQARQFR